MAQTVKDTALDTRTARSRLDVRKKPYYRLLDEGVHLGYRRNASGGVWLARLYMGEGKYRLERIGTADDKADADGVAVLSFAQAQKKARELHVGAARAAVGLPVVSTGPFTVAKAIADYLAWLESEGRSPEAIGNTRSKCTSLILPRLGALRVDRLNRAQLEHWLHGLARTAPLHRAADMRDAETRRRRRASANRTLGVLKAALSLAWRNERVHDDKAWRRLRPFKGTVQSRARCLTLDECRRLVNACDEGFGEIVRGALFTGCRWSELCRLAPGDVNEDTGTIAVRTSKSGKPRHVVLADDGIAFFAQAVAKAGTRQHLFVRDDGQHWRTGWQAKPMSSACARAAIVPPASFHILRHTAASHAVMNGAALLLVAKNLGHADTRMTEMHYGHLSANFVTDEIRRTAPRFESVSDRVVTRLRTR